MDSKNARYREIKAWTARNHSPSEFGGRFRRVEILIIDLPQTNTIARIAKASHSNFRYRWDENSRPCRVICSMRATTANTTKMATSFLLNICPRKVVE